MIHSHPQVPSALRVLHTGLHGRGETGRRLRCLHLSRPMVGIVLSYGLLSASETDVSDGVLD